MSNYLIVVSEQKHSESVKKWLDDHSGEGGDFIELDTGSGTTLSYVAKSAASDVYGTGSIFKGFGIDYRRKQLVFTASGAESYKHNNMPLLFLDEPMEGCYLSAERSGAEILVSNDLFSMMPMAYFMENGVVAISDSVFMLRELLGALGIPVSLDERVAIAASWDNAMVGQIFSENTLIRQIKYSPVGANLRIGVGTDGRISSSVIRSSLPDLFGLDPTDEYRSAIRGAAQKIASVLRTLSGFSYGAVRMGISGGQDSRVCLAAALVSDRARSQAVFNCNPNGADGLRDHEVATRLSESFDFTLGAAPGFMHSSNAKVRNSFGLWYLACAGLYGFLGMRYNSPVHPCTFVVSGHGGELIKGNYGWRDIRAISGNIDNPRAAESFREESETSLSRFGVDPSTPLASEWHYLAFRNAVHSGRFVQTHLYGFRPLMMRDLVALGRSRASEFPMPGKADKSMITDLLCVISPDIAAEPFDRKFKKIGGHYAVERCRRLGGRLLEAELDEYAVFGDPGQVQHGHAGVFENVTKAKRLWLTPRRDSVLELATSGFECLNDGVVRETYLPVLRDAQDKLADAAMPFVSMRASAGKLMAFNLLG